MSTISENLQTIKNSTDAIRQAILNKGGNITGDISTLAEAIEGISGGNSLLFDKFTYDSGLILNKLSGGVLTAGEGLIELETKVYEYNFTSNPYSVIFLHDSFGYNSNWIGTTDNTYGTITPSSDAVTVKCVNGVITFQHLQANSVDSLMKDHWVALLIINHELNTFDYDYFIVRCSNASCLLKDTEISLNNGVTKKIQDITYNDELLVWNFDEAKFDKAKPLWIKKKEIDLSYYKVTLENGTILNLVGSNGKCHRLFNYDDQLFESATDLVGKQVSTLQGLSKVISCEKIEETCEYYNIITEYHMNCYANGVLTSCRYNNLYPIIDMKFDKAQVKLEPRYKIHAEKFKPNPEILSKYIRGMRLDENTTISIEDMKKYISNIERVRKNIDDFEENQEMVESVEEANVGWIDPEGNVYGYKLYMPGQMSHNKLADKICKKLGYKEQELEGFSKTLEDLGWSKFTDDYLLTTSELTDKQEHTLTKFISNNPKVKKRGTIKLGNIFSEPTNIENVKKMHKKDLTNKMRGYGNKRN